MNLGEAFKVWAAGMGLAVEYQDPIQWERYKNAFSAGAIYGAECIAQIPVNALRFRL